MKKTILLLSFAILFNCDEKVVEQTNGFGPYEGQSVYLGDQSSVEIFKALDKAWASRDYSTMKSTRNMKHATHTYRKENNKINNVKP